jgi:GTPase SAR1 family protein
VYDITDKHSFERLKYWMDDLEINGNKLEERILVGSKIDREADKEGG